MQKEKKLKFFTECQDPSTQQRNSLPSVRFLALGKVIKKKLCQVPNSNHSAKSHRWVLTVGGGRLCLV
jgi:hypothetical protein